MHTLGSSPSLDLANIPATKCDHVADPKPGFLQSFDSEPSVVLVGSDILAVVPLLSPNHWLNQNFRSHLLSDAGSCGEPVNDR